MNTGEQRNADLRGESPTPPEETGGEIYMERSHSNSSLMAGAVVLAVVAVCGATYGWFQHRAAQQFAAERQAMSASLDQARTQADTLSARLTTVQAEAEAARAAAEGAKMQAVPAAAEGAPHHAVRRAAVHRQPVDDPRWKQVQQQLGDQQNELAEHRQKLAETQANLDQAKADLEGKLQSAQTELGGGIARNHDELVALQKKGERNYYEFDFSKSKDFHHVGPISISLRKANTKHDYCDLEMLVNDQSLSRKHINLYEAVTLYPEGYPLPLEVVINHIAKDSIHGYVSEPKYRPAQQQAAGTETGKAASTAVAAAAPAAANPQLEHRPDDTQTH